MYILTFLWTITQNASEQFYLSLCISFVFTFRGLFSAKKVCKNNELNVKWQLSRNYFQECRNLQLQEPLQEKYYITRKCDCIQVIKFLKYSSSVHSIRCLFHTSLFKSSYLSILDTSHGRFLLFQTNKYWRNKKKTLCKKCNALYCKVSRKHGIVRTSGDHLVSPSRQDRVT